MAFKFNEYSTQGAKWLVDKCSKCRRHAFVADVILTASTAGYEAYNDLSLSRT